MGVVSERPDDRRGIADAFAAAEKARALRDKATPKEQALIDAIGVRYVKEFRGDRRVDQDRAYAEAMKKVADQYPDDLEILTLYADALFILEPRRGTRDLNNANVKRLHEALERVLTRDVTHPGACHLYVHATESTVEPGRAEKCAEFLGRSIPGASHINHMPSHTFNEIGRWGDSVRANLDAWHSDLEGRRRRRLRDLSGAQPAHAALRRVVRRPGRDRDARRQGLPEAEQHLVLRSADDGSLRTLRRGAAR